jgi:hypothetical protein
MTKKKTPTKVTLPPDDERWEPIQVATHLSVAYQAARNRMLQGEFGASEYDAKTRKLTVLASRVRKAKTTRTRPAKSAQQLPKTVPISGTIRRAK